MSARVLKQSGRRFFNFPRTDVLDFYEYSRSDIAALVRRCHYDEPDSKKNQRFSDSKCVGVAEPHASKESNSDSCSQHHRGPLKLEVRL